MFLLLGMLSFAAALVLVAQAVTLPARRRRALVARVAQYGGATAPVVGRRRPGFGSRRSPLVDGIAAGLAKVVLRVMPRTTREDVQERVLAAGYGQRLTPERLLAAKAVLGLFGAFFGLLIGLQLPAATAFLLFICFLAVGFVGPDIIVNGRIRDRRERVLAALPDALDLLAVSVEAGLGFDGAVAKLVEYMDGPLIEEFALTLNEMRIGESRMDALRRMASRAGVPEVATFVRAVIQADQLGTSMANMLRVQAADARIRRQHAAEEKAMKAPIKMLVPTIVFIFPALFILVLGPILINFGELI